MPKQRAGTLLDVQVTFASKVPLHRQLYVAMKNAILKGRLRPATRLPSTRMFAEDLRVSRTTVLTAFDQLAAEGYVEGRVGSGTRVTSSVPNDLFPEAVRGKRRVDVSQLQKQLARRARVPGISKPPLLRGPGRPLLPGQPDLSLFPVELWSRLAAKHAKRALYDLAHLDSLGYRPLRQAICDYVARLRGVRCEPDQVLIVSGAQQALFLCAHSLLEPGEPVWMEDPGYPRARAAFLGAGLRIVPVPVDSQGMIIATGRKRESSPKLIFVTPSFQCPTGSMMSLQRRFDLLRLSAAKKAWILEDDFFSEFRYGSGPVASLQSLDRNERVIYIGNFSKSVVPSLRIGYLILPPSLVDAFKKIRPTLSRQPPGGDQAVLAEFLGEGHLEKYVRATLRLYRERQEALIEAIRNEDRGMLEVTAGGTGMYLVAWLKPGVNDDSVARAAVAHDVDVVPLSTFAIKPLERSGLVLGFSAYEPWQIRAAVTRLSAAMANS